eukprot:jgi/Botrbrau1/14112/Bobra.182_3s0055.1
MTPRRAPYIDFLPAHKGPWLCKTFQAELAPKRIDQTIHYTQLRGGLDCLRELIAELQQSMEIFRTEISGTGSRGLLPCLS